MKRHDLRILVLSSYSYDVLYFIKYKKLLDYNQFADSTSHYLDL